MARDVQTKETRARNHALSLSERYPTKKPAKTEAQFARVRVREACCGLSPIAVANAVAD